MKRNLLAVSHDAGGAEILSSYLRHKRGDYKALYCVAVGPAQSIYVRKGLAKCMISVACAKKLLSDGRVGFVLTSASWGSGLESAFIAQANKKSIETVVMLDHWVNYTGRVTSRPSRIWVVDRFAKKIAEKEFGRDTRITVKPNYYYKDLRSEYSASAHGKRRGIRLNILFLSDANAEFCAFRKEKMVFDDVEKVAGIVETIKGAKPVRPVSLRIRLHPAERLSKYSLVTAGGCDALDIEVSDPRRNSIIDDIRSSDLVLGMRSSALIISSLFKNTVSLCDELPAWFLARGIKGRARGLNELLRNLKR
jgi:hypothetical protein